jgi:hypothetical protein
MRVALSTVLTVSFLALASLAFAQEQASSPPFTRGGMLEAVDATVQPMIVEHQFAARAPDDDRASDHPLASSDPLRGHIGLVSQLQPTKLKSDRRTTFILVGVVVAAVVIYIVYALHHMDGGITIH